MRLDELTVWHNSIYHPLTETLAQYDELHNTSGAATVRAQLQELSARFARPRR